MKLSDYAKRQGINYQTAYRWYISGKIPHKTTKMPSGTIIVDMTDEKSTSNEVVLYARVSSHDQKSDLNRQMDRLRSFASSNGFIVKEEISEIASGMNSKRPKLNKILSDSKYETIIVEHKDRLTRFGFELIENSLLSSNRKIIIINKTPNEMDIVQDFIDVVTSMCSRIYGIRGSKNRIDKIKKVINDTNE